MKKILTPILASIITLPGIASVNVSISSQKNDTQPENPESVEYLQSEIIQLEQQLEQKKEKLDKCAKKNKNFKIAGITTVGLTGVGAVANVAMYSKQQQQKKQAEKMISDIQTASTELDKQNAERVSILHNCSNETKFGAISDEERAILTQLEKKPNYYDEKKDVFIINNMSEEDVTKLKTISDKMVAACKQKQNKQTTCTVGNGVTCGG